MGRQQMSYSGQSEADVAQICKSMRFLHHDFAFELNDEWWAAAGMEGWTPVSRSYRVDRQKLENC